MNKVEGIIPNNISINPVDNIEIYACKICGAHASGFHFDAQSCSACAAAFRRNVALNRTFICDTGKNNCIISFKQSKNCRACRYRKCFEAGMKAEAVKAGKDQSQSGRSYFTMSGIKRNKRFGQSLGIDSKYLETSNIYKPRRKIRKDSGEKQLFNSRVNQSEVISSTAVSVICNGINNREMLQRRWNKEFKKFPGNSLYSSEGLFKLSSNMNVLDYLIQEEKRINERRRILFCERPVSSLFGVTSTKPFTRTDIKPLNFRKYTKSIRIHILFIYEWMRGWEFFSHLNFSDQTTFLRKCVLYHTVLDPSFISYQIGDMTKFVLPNGGFVSTIPTDSSGWSDEKHISGANKKYIYWPLLQRVKTEIMQPMIDMEITFYEFCALKAFASLEGSKHDVSIEAKQAMQRESENLSLLLHDYYRSIGISEDLGAVRIGNLYLLLSPVFDISDNFVESHHQVHFFDIWKLDDLLLQFLKKKT
uniref:Nuclear receptor domain-containing protein n=1 Tax=Parastrongyloides trichosuri TaxID=131310 RepID=A0A0N5A1S5_PARTI